MGTGEERTGERAMAGAVLKRIRDYRPDWLPYLAVSEPNGFWQYNRSLFLRFCLAALYSGVLYVGLVVALFAINQLFKAQIASVVYARLWLTISFVFNTWFFLAGVPRDLPALEEHRERASLKLTFSPRH